MKPWAKKKLIGTSAFLVLILASGYIFFSYVLSGICKNEIFFVSASPDEKYKAVMFERNCGATTGFSTQVSILELNSELENESGNILTADGHPKGNQIVMSWPNPNVLIVRTNSAHTYKKEIEFRNIQVKYE